MKDIPTAPRPTSDLIYELSRWIDQSPANQARDPEALLWGRVAKVSEEAGEAISALVLALGHNPRKPQTGHLHDVERELLDVASAALCAIAHLHERDGNTEDVLALLDEHVRQLTARADLTQEPI